MNRPPLPVAHEPDDPMARWHLLAEERAPTEETLQFWDGVSDAIYVGKVNIKQEVRIMNVPAPWPEMLYWARMEEL